MSDNFDLNLPNEEKQRLIPRKVRIILAILAVTAFVILLAITFRPKAQKRPIPETVVTVEVIEASRKDYPIIVNTNGTIQADIRGNLVAQISGEIIKVSDNFKNGGAFTADEVLIEIDERDYLAEVSQALSAVSQAKAALQQEQALAKQAQTDWKRLGNSGKPPTLVAREPQLAAARAQLSSAQARYETAKLNLSRTKIKAPYAGRVIQRNAVPGQFIVVGASLAEIFATEGVEIRLPVSQDEYTQLGLDKLNFEAETGGQSEEFSVNVQNQLGSQTYAWDAVVTRTDSIFDLTTRQIDVIAEVNDPFSQDGSKPPLKIGQFVNASIVGRTLKDVITVPNKALREGSYVFTSQDNKLVRTPVTLSWQDDRNAVIESGLSDGDIVVTTSLNSTLAGARVKYQGSDNNSDILNNDKVQQANGTSALDTESGSPTAQSAPDIPADNSSQ